MGSYVSRLDEIVLLVDEARVAEAVRDLVRIGFDRVTGFAPTEVLGEAELAGIWGRSQGLSCVVTAHN